jgi:hypothetical protein
MASSRPAGAVVRDGKLVRTTWQRPRRADRFALTYKEASMALARVVSFDGVSTDRVEELKREITEGGGRPEGMPATEIVVLHDSAAEKSIVIVFFDNEDDYRKGDEVLDAMPAGDTPGRRASVGKYDVAVRMSG